MLASISGSNLPSPHAAFAVVLLDDGRILIQGGTDAAFQTNLADGWILDPLASSMTWTAIPRPFPSRRKERSLCVQYWWTDCLRIWCVIAPRSAFPCGI